jgi:hypothetical protein
VEMQLLSKDPSLPTNQCTQSQDKEGKNVLTSEGVIMSRRHLNSGKVDKCRELGTLLELTQQSI